MTSFGTAQAGDAVNASGNHPQEPSAGEQHSCEQHSCIERSAHSTTSTESVALTGGRPELTPERGSSDGGGELGEGGWEPLLWIDIHTEFVMAATQVLDERVSCADHPG